MSFIYYIILLFILFFILNLFMKNKEKSPKKLKLYFTISLSLFLLRYLTLLLICLLKDSETVHLLKNIVYLNYLVIPLIILALFFIYVRFDNVSFNTIYGVGGILVCMYIVFMACSTGIVTLDINFGYVIQLKYGEIITSLIVLVLGMFLILSMIFIDKPNINKKGISTLVLILVVVLMENILILIKCSIMPYTIISEVVFLIMVDRAIDGFKKKKIYK